MYFVNFKNYTWFMTKIFCILLLSNENKNKMLALLGKWVYWVWVWFYPKPGIFYGFFIFKTLLTQLPNPTHFFEFLKLYYKSLDSDSYIRGQIWSGFRVRLGLLFFKVWWSSKSDADLQLLSDFLSSEPRCWLLVDLSSDLLP
jgi:hypothetical protein